MVIINGTYSTPQLTLALTVFNGAGGYSVPRIANPSPTLANVFAIDCKGTIRIGPNRGSFWGVYDDQVNTILSSIETTLTYET